MLGQDDTRNVQFEVVLHEADGMMKHVTNVLRAPVKNRKSVFSGTFLMDVGTRFMRAHGDGGVVRLRESSNQEMTIQQRTNKLGDKAQF